jgi:hypothetical protein
MSDYYFEGDPATDSARRQLERLLRQQQAPRRWGWIAAVVAGGGSLYLWHLLGRFRSRHAARQP